MKVSTVRYEHGVWSAAFPSLDSAQTLVVAFCAPGYARRVDLLDELAAAYPSSVIVGCSTAGEISQTRVVDDSIVVAVVQFATTRLRWVACHVAETSNSQAAGQAVARDLADPDLRAMFVVAGGVGINGSELALGLTEHLPKDVAVTGGLAGDGTRFTSSWVMVGGRPCTDTVVGVGFYGSDLRVSHGSRGGWDAFGPERIVTSSSGNLLHALDGRPALELYKSYLGERAAELPGSALLFPLAVRSPDGDVVVRTILGVDEQTQSMRFAGDVPQGRHARLMHANFDRLVLGAHIAGEITAVPHVGPTLVLAVSCVGRRLVLRDRIEEEVEATLEPFAPGTTQIGFYSYGELSPQEGGRCDLHNQTMTLTAFSEAA
ncbi:MAG: FIST N-terminal domain-containing protein [Kofleriaceae bacterium]